MLGLAGSILSVHWAVDSYNASVVSQRLLAHNLTASRGNPLSKGMHLPQVSWWSTTPLQLTNWSLYLERSPEEEEQTERPEELLEAAVRIAPLHPAARLDRVKHAAGANRPGQLAQSLGLSHDAESLAWSARTLRLAGKTESALRVYRQALQIACRVDHSTVAELGFSDDPSVRRYLLPGESSALTIIREMVKNSGWTFQDWSPALPADTIAILAAGRVLREQGQAEAQTLLDHIVDAKQAENTMAGDRAIRLAMKAEACALLSRWKEAQQSYRQAIDEVDDLTTRRSWWFNLANVALQLDDQRQRSMALQAAIDVPISDEISRRALELQRNSEPVARLRSGATKAN
jgi:tetratricopeptide (TPR) repeat protein